MRVGGQRHVPAALPPGKETRYPLYRRLGRPQGRSGRVRKISPLPGFDTRTVQPVASRYTDCAIPADLLTLESGIKKYIVSKITANHLKTGVEPIPETSFMTIEIYLRQWSMFKTML
jgi:hypothetical protein